LSVDGRFIVGGGEAAESPQFQMSPEALIYSAFKGKIYNYTNTQLFTELRFDSIITRGKASGFESGVPMI